MTTLKPLAERMRPETLEHYYGQSHLVGPDGILRKMIEARRLPSLILWGPPGVGKTTLSEIIARSLGANFYSLSAVHSGVKDVREALEQIAKDGGGIFSSDIRPILFIDEIHRFSKSQQDSLLGAVEQGVVTLIGATTENPSFEVIRPLLSRCQVYTLSPLSKEEILALLHHALTSDEMLSKRRIELSETDALMQLSGGDARRALNILELVTLSTTADPLYITNSLVSEHVQANWLARLIEGGEDPSFIARRLMISAAEDIGLANPNALLLANACAMTLDRIGWPEGRIPLAEAVIYLACSEKSNSAYNAINNALTRVRATGNLPVPLHLRNAPTELMSDLGYGAGYLYAHDYPGHFVQQQYLPDAIVGERFWQSDEANASEVQMMNRWRLRWGQKPEE